jgi:predicted phage-related endonuclease
MALTICCATCGFKENCGNCCDSAKNIDPRHCPDAEVTESDMVAFQSAIPATLQKITTLFEMKKQMEEQEEILRAELLKAMEMHGIMSFENAQIKMTYVAPTTRTSIDTKRLKKDHPDIAEEYSKTSSVAASVRVALKGGGK